MKLPEMIIFDYGGTLEHITLPIDTISGYGAIFEHVISNKNNVSLQELNDFGEEIFEKLWNHRYMGFEIHEWNFMRFVLEYLQLELDISVQEADKLFLHNNYPYAPTPGIDKLLDYLHSRGIRTAVISNITCSGEALEERIGRLLPAHRFEFIIATSEYIIRKPSPMIFELAVRKAGLNAADVWYCGDNVSPDVEGPASAGLFPVFYSSKEAETAVPHLHIRHWDELITKLEGLAK